MFDSRGQADRDEVIAKRKAEVTLGARRGLKEAGSKDEYEAYGGGRADKGLRGPYPSSRLVVNLAAAREKESSLLREICEASGIRARGGDQIHPDHDEEVSRAQTRSGSRLGY